MPENNAVTNNAKTALKGCGGCLGVMLVISIASAIGLPVIFGDMPTKNSAPVVADQTPTSGFVPQALQAANAAAAANQNPPADQELAYLSKLTKEEAEKQTAAVKAKIRQICDSCNRNIEPQIDALKFKALAEGMYAAQVAESLGQQIFNANVSSERIRTYYKECFNRPSLKDQVELLAQTIDKRDADIERAKTKSPYSMIVKLYNDLVHKCDICSEKSLNYQLMKKIWHVENYNSIWHIGTYQAMARLYKEYTPEAKNFRQNALDELKTRQELEKSARDLLIVYARLFPDDTAEAKDLVKTLQTMIIEAKPFAELDGEEFLAYHTNLAEQLSKNPLTPAGIIAATATVNQARTQSPKLWFEAIINQHIHIFEKTLANWVEEKDCDDFFFYLRAQTGIDSGRIVSDAQSQMVVDRWISQAIMKINEKQCGIDDIEAMIAILEGKSLVKPEYFSDGGPFKERLDQSIGYALRDRDSRDGIQLQKQLLTRIKECLGDPKDLRNILLGYWREILRIAKMPKTEE